MLELAGLADDRGLAVALRLAGLNAQCFDTALTEQSAEFLANGDEGVEVLGVLTGEGVFNHGHGQRLAGRGRNTAPHFDACFVKLHNDFADFGWHGWLLDSGGVCAWKGCAFQRKPSHWLMPVAASPAMRACTRGPVLMARMNTISSASGAPGTRTSMASKWLRT